MIEHAFRRYYDTSGLFGTPEGCLALVNRLEKIGVDEVACLIDFGIEPDLVLAHLSDLNRMQIKFNGHRIEVGEIEARLDRHPRVDRSVIKLIEVENQNRELVAFLTSKDSGSVDAEELRRYLRGWLPEIMIPSKFVHLESFPLTPNGKIDHKMLLVPKPADSKLASDAEPQNELQAAVARIWCKVLKVDRIGIYANFLASGGDSLSAIDLVLEIQQQFGIDFPLHHVFEGPTIAEIALRLDAIMAMAPRSGDALKEPGLIIERAVDVSPAEMMERFEEHS